jgi:adenosylcobyric acid synthase
VHGLFENDGFRVAVLRDVAARAGKRWVPGGLDFAALRLARLDRIADTLEAHLDLDRLANLIELASRTRAIGTERRQNGRGGEGAP